MTEPEDRRQTADDDHALILHDDPQYPGAGLMVEHEMFQPSYASSVQRNRFRLRVWNAGVTVAIVLTDNQASDLQNWLVRRTERA